MSGLRSLTDIVEEQRRQRLDHERRRKERLRSRSRQGPALRRLDTLIYPLYSENVESPPLQGRTLTTDLDRSEVQIFVPQIIRPGHWIKFVYPEIHLGAVTGDSITALGKVISCQRVLWNRTVLAKVDYPFRITLRFN